MRSLFLIVIFGFATDISSVNDSGFTSVYTEWSGPGCESFDSEVEGADGWTVCQGVGDYQLQIFYNFYGHEFISVESDRLAFSTSLTTTRCSASHYYGAKIEWRLAEGEPFACIIRVICLAENESGELITEGEYLIVKGLDGHEDIDFEIDVRTEPDANRKARELAESYF